MNKKIEKIKKMLNSKSVMLTISMLIMIILLISATIAWFVLSRTADISLFQNKVSEWDFIVSETSMGEPISEDEILEFSVDKFINVQEDVLAPGTSGKIDLYVRTTTDVVTDFVIYIDNAGLKLNAYTAGDDMTEEEIEAEKEKNSKMLQKHIRFYADELFTTETDMENPIKGTLKPNEEKKVTIYWHWLYDGTDNIPEDMTEEEQIKSFLKEWDEEDNFISDNRASLAGTIKITAYGTQQKPEKVTEETTEEETTEEVTETTTVNSAETVQETTVEELTTEEETTTEEATQEATT